MQTIKHGVVGTEHDFGYWHHGVMITGVWHSDKGEWTVATEDGPYWQVPTRDEAIALSERLAAGTVEAGGSIA